MHVLDLFLRPVSWIATVLLRPCLWSLRVPCSDVWIVDLHAGNCDVPTEFHDQIDHALRFIREHDPRRAKWIDEHLNYIVNSNLPESGGEYMRNGRICRIDYGSCRKSVAGQGEITPSAQKVLTIKVAQTIVHEATHARIDQWGIKYNERYWERIEKCCWRQECQFLKRAVPEFRDLFGNVVDWEANSAESWTEWQEWYRERWKKSHFEAVRDQLRRISQYCIPTPTWKERHRSLWNYGQRFNPWTEAMLRSRAIYHYYAKNFAEATADFRRLAAVEPDHKDKDGWLAANLYYNHEYQKSLDLWLAAYDGNATAAGWISNCNYMLDRHEEALRWYERAAEGLPDEADSRGERAVLLIGTGRYQEARRELEHLAHESDAEFGTFDFSYRTLHAWLLHDVGERERFREIRDEVYAARDWWLQCCDPEPARTRAWVLKVRDDIYRPGIEPYRAQLLICSDDLPPIDWRGFMEQLSSEILASKTANGGGYENAYLRSLLSWNDEYPWREVPDNLTDGKRVYVVDMMLDRLFLPGGYLQGPTVTCWVAKTPDGNKAALAETYNASAQGSWES